MEKSGNLARQVSDVKITRREKRLAFFFYLVFYFHLFAGILSVWHVYPREKHAIAEDKLTGGERQKKKRAAPTCKS